MSALKTLPRKRTPHTLSVRKMSNLTSSLNPGRVSGQAWKAHSKNTIRQGERAQRSLDKYCLPMGVYEEMQDKYVYAYTVPRGTRHFRSSEHSLNNSFTTDAV